MTQNCSLVGSSGGCCECRCVQLVCAVNAVNLTTAVALNDYKIKKPLNNTQSELTNKTQSSKTSPKINKHYQQNTQHTHPLHVINTKNQHPTYTQTHNPIKNYSDY
ncbi:hypothetical protein [Candidatus Bathycorpusculum sp.]|uniref:hypothetical protein n=1 Tax=Candidatus Bathycorpusculum sp. TaxID=2994959 RepID=UPI00281F3015|nr:hypothetical protein [Candidatus Termitimicrobium sp.]MCL2432849.1 hypothetical protein [Candidatus Termitimicrobium sp.]